MKIVVSQPMYFPWVGIFEQIRLCDVYVHYDDVQLPQGRSFINRVQIKTKDGVKWLSVPLKRNTSSDTLIKDTYISYEENWLDRHLKFLQHSYAKSPFKADMLAIVEQIYKHKFDTISLLNIFAIEEIAKYFGIYEQKTFSLSSSLKFTSVSSQHLLDIVKHYRSNVYITGWGAKNYIDYSIFENHDIDIRYMDYIKSPYPQLYGEFTPFVSILDLIANVGKEGINYITSGAKTYKEFLP